MIIDNADGMTMFSRLSQSNDSSQSTTTNNQRFASYRPNAANSVILIITRNKKLGDRFTRSRAHSEVKVDEMQDDEAEALLRTRLPEEDYKPGELSALVSRLEKLPLALVQAAAFLKAQSMSRSGHLVNSRLWKIATLSRLSPFPLHYLFCLSYVQVVI